MGIGMFTLVPLAFGLGLFPQGAEAQSFSDIRFQSIHVERGVVPSTVFDILEDNRGFLWLGTESGLMRYDGYHLHTFELQSVDSAGISGNMVRGLLQDAQFKIWVCTEHGLNRYDPDTESFTHFLHDPDIPTSISDNGIYCAVQDSQGFIWVGTYFGGLNRLDPQSGTFTHFRHSMDDPHGLASDKVRVLLIDSDGMVWAGTDRGLNRIDPLSGDMQRFTHHQDDPSSLSHHDVRGLYQDDTGRLWIATTGGLNVMDVESGTCRHFFHDHDDPSSLSDNWVNVVMGTESGAILAGTKDGGLNVWDPETESFFAFQRDRYTDNSIAGNNVLCVYPDRSGLIWVGMYLSGLNYFQAFPKPFSVFRYHPAKPDSLSNNQVRAICEDSRGDVWVGTLDGLNLLDRKTRTFRRYRYRPKDPGSLPVRQVTAIEEHVDGHIWLGTYFGGVVVLDPQTDTFTRFRHHASQASSLSHDVVNALYRDNEGRMWVGTRGGLDRFDGLGFVHQSGVFRECAQGQVGEVRTIFQDRSGRMWVGFDGRGLYRFVPEEKQIDIFRHDPDDRDSLSHDFVTSICEDSSGVLWVGTRAGLNQFQADSGTFVVFGEADGLPNSMIRGIVEGGPRELWISTAGGLARFRADHGDVRFFDASDGLQGSEFVVGAVCKTADGTLFFGGVNGLSMFRPEEIVVNRRQPPVVITSFRVFGQDFPLDQPLRNGSKIELSHDDNFFSFEFAALDFTAPQKNRYAYMLEGLDKDWIQAGTRRFASYTNVDSGSYVFRVRGTNSDGIWSDTESALALRIIPPFWITPWFVGLCLLALALVIFAAYRYKTHSIRVQKDRLEREVEQRTKALFETQQKLMDSAHAAGMAEVATGVIHNIGNILNSVNISAENISHILGRSQLGALFKANELLESHLDHIIDYLTNDPKGMMLLKFYLNVGRVLEAERSEIRRETDDLNEKVQLIKEAIVTQQSYAKAAFHSEYVSICRLIDDALKLQAASLAKRNVQIIKKYHDEPVCLIPRLKLIHTFTNLIKNAREAMESVARDRRFLTIEVNQTEKETTISIADTGYGIEAENLNRIFGFGFSTKRDGHGFGLHSSANAIAELGGTIRAFSTGPDQGSRFEITIPKKDAVEAG